MKCERSQWLCRHDVIFDDGRYSSDGGLGGGYNHSSSGVCTVLITVVSGYVQRVLLYGLPLWHLLPHHRLDA